MDHHMIFADLCSVLALGSVSFRRRAIELEYGGVRILKLNGLLFLIHVFFVYHILLCPMVDPTVNKGQDALFILL